MPFSKPSIALQVLAYVTAVPVAFAFAGTMHYLLAAMRRGGVVARFVARVGIIGMFYTTFATVMVGIAGPYVFKSRTTWDEILGIGLTIGVVGAVVWPVVNRRGGGDDLGM